MPTTRKRQIDFFDFAKLFQEEFGMNSNEVMDRTFSECGNHIHTEVWCSDKEEEFTLEMFRSREIGIDELTCELARRGKIKPGKILVCLDY